MYQFRPNPNGIILQQPPNKRYNFCNNSLHLINGNSRPTTAPVLEWDLGLANFPWHNCNFFTKVSVRIQFSEPHSKMGQTLVSSIETDESGERSPWKAMTLPKRKKAWRARLIFSSIAWVARWSLIHHQYPRHLLSALIGISVSQVY